MNKRALGGPRGAHLQRNGSSYTVAPPFTVQIKPQKLQSPLTQAQSTTRHALGSTPVALLSYPAHGGSS